MRAAAHDLRSSLTLAATGMSSGKPQQSEGSILQFDMGSTLRAD